jgi:hypothetical protein
MPPRQELDEIPLLLPTLKHFVAHPDSVVANVPMLYKTAPIDYTDPLFELLPEAYLDSPTPSQGELERAVAEMTRETAAFLVRFGRERIAERFDAKN